MAISFCDEFKINPKAFSKTKALDVILDLDTRYFIDPKLISLCKIPEFRNAENSIKDFFSNIKSLILASKTKNDMFWKKADKLLTFTEYSNTCLGYSDNGTQGNAIGPKLRSSLLEILQTLLIAGQEDIKIFELLGIFQEGFGSDRISDLITYILLESVIKYTDRITKELKISNTRSIKYKNVIYKLPFNKYNNKPLFLLPKSILSPLPVAYDYDDIDYVCSENERVRNDINEIIDLGSEKKLSKQQIRTLLMTCPSYKTEMLAKYTSQKCTAYDFEKDVYGRINWYEISKSISEQYPLEIKDVEYTKNGVRSIVEQIISQFKDLVENNSLYKLFYNDDKTRKKEEAIQLLFYGIADKYCKDNDIDCSRETNSGRGPVDFKFSKGYKCKIAVEVKWSTNDLDHGYDIQLPIYMKQENAELGYYIVVNAGTNDKKVNAFNAKYSNLDKETKDTKKYILIDGRYKESASIAKSIYKL